MFQLHMQMWKTPQGAYLVSMRRAFQNEEQLIYSLHGSSRSASESLARIYELVKRGETRGYFDRKTDKASSDLYFHYYGMLQHQQNMLQDYIRTGTYYAAITENEVDFKDKVVMDVGCGSGILSLFAAKAGAKLVYAVEASNMAHFAEILARENADIGSRIRVLHGKVEDLSIPEKVDVLVSEPMGTLLVNERMLETYIYARDRYLIPGGSMFPTVGTIHIAAFSDDILHSELASRALFWQQRSFYGVNLTCLHEPAKASYFSQVVVDQIPPNVLVSNYASHVVDFTTCKEEDLYAFEIPISLQVGVACIIHGIATWFDVSFNGSTCKRVLSTAPGMPTTHWFQLRCVLENPITIHNAGDSVRGVLRFKAHNRQSYDLFLELTGPPNPDDPSMQSQVSTGQFDLKEPYYRQLNMMVNAGAWDASGDPAGHQGGHVAGMSQAADIDIDTNQFLV